MLPPLLRRPALTALSRRLALLGTLEALTWSALADRFTVLLQDFANIFDLIITQTELLSNVVSTNYASTHELER